MCGIAGIVGHNWERRSLEAMVAVQHHRGPDDSGIYVDEVAGVGLGHNRLSIIDLSSAGHQPMSNQDNTSWIVFNGEVYNYLELRAELRDYPYQSQTDTEVILAAYERWGDACVERFIGMFAFAIWDSRRRRLFCARDRIGIKPFHYAWHNGCFVFGSEIKAILAAGHSVSPNMSVWATYLCHGYYDHTPETFFGGVYTLQPGHTLTLANGQVTILPYWDLAAESAEPLEMDDEEAASSFLALLEDSVRLRLRSDVPVGVNLSGGLDSASLMITVDRLLQTEGEVQTFTACFEDPFYDEEDFASNVASHTPWARYFQRLSEDEVWDIAWEALWYQEAPFGGIATLAYHHLQRLAQAHRVTVLLEGQGPDEMLAGYDYFRPHYYADLFEQGRWLDFRRELRVSKGGDTALDGIRDLLTGEELNVYQDGSAHLMAHCVSPQVRSLASNVPSFPKPFGNRLSNALYRDLRYTKLPRVLRMNDRLSMAFSREFREPYLDHRLVEFLFRLPAHQKIRLGQSKFLMRHAMTDHLPETIRLAGKRSVVTPQREWLRTTLRPNVEEVIYSHSFAERGIFDPVQVQTAYERFCQGEGENAFPIWQWVNTELWFRMFVDKDPLQNQDVRGAHATGSPYTTRS